MFLKHTIHYESVYKIDLNRYNLTYKSVAIKLKGKSHFVSGWKAIIAYATIPKWLL